MIARPFMHVVSTLLLTAGCGGGGGTFPFVDAAVDAAVDVDGPTVDAPGDLIDAPLATGTHYHYVVDRLLLPQTNAQARTYGLDLNGDATVDNQLGMVMATLAGQGYDSQADADDDIDRGTVMLLLDVQTSDFTTAAVSGAAVFKGTSSTPAACNGAGDTTCRRHLTGTATFQVAATPVNPPLTGAFVNGAFNGGPGGLSIPLMMFGATPTDVQLIGARVRFSSISSTAIATGILAGAVPESEIDAKVIPSIRNAFMSSVSADCTMLASPPNCGCPQGSDGKTALNLFDADPKDCSISIAEVQNNSLIQALLAPDVRINNVDALSVGLGITAVPASFVTP